MNHLRPSIARIKRIKSETEDVRTFTLEAADTLQEKTALPGQFNMVGYPAVGEAPISFSALENGTIEHTIRSAGRVTKFIFGLKVGNDLFIRGPYGRGWPMDQCLGKDLLLIAGGIGLAPLRPVVQTVIANRRFFGEVSLIYGARNEASLLFNDELDEWKMHLSVSLSVDAVQGTGWQYDTGPVTVPLRRIGVSPDRTVVFVCGPELMMRFVSTELLMKRVPQSSIFLSLERRMHCGLGQCGHCQHYGRFVCKDGPVFPYREVRGLPDGLL